MGRSKLKKKLQQTAAEKLTTREESTSAKVPINNLPEKFLWMHVSPRVFRNYGTLFNFIHKIHMQVKSGTKIRNVLGYALKEFPSYNNIVWTGNGHGIAKVISCAEIFKRKHEGLHQVTKLCYIR